uniref:Uncharacterized protein n=1 Tax=Oryzias melastigma TaxID=30732 RepID=A0A3B3D3F8_ORYME
MLHFHELTHQVVFSLEYRIPGTLPTRRTTILSLLLPVRTFTALLMVMLSRLMPFTSTNLSPTCRPASSVDHHGGWRGLLSQTVQHELSSKWRNLKKE